MLKSSFFIIKLIVFLTSYSNIILKKNSVKNGTIFSKHTPKNIEN